MKDESEHLLHFVIRPVSFLFYGFLSVISDPEGFRMIFRFILYPSSFILSGSLDQARSAIVNCWW